jgi:hypothetical protein
MAEGRRLRGEGLENLEDYVQERATYASDSDELAEQNRTLEQELADLQQLHLERSQPNARTDVDALIDAAQTRVDRMRNQQGGTLETEAGTATDFEKLPPDAAARARVVGDAGASDIGESIR